MELEKHITIRIDSDLSDKLYFAAKYNYGSKNVQIINLVRMFVSEFEKEHGKITKEDIRQLRS